MLQCWKWWGPIEAVGSKHPAAACPRGHLLRRVGSNQQRTGLHIFVVPGDVSNGPEEWWDSAASETWSCSKTVKSQRVVKLQQSSELDYPGWQTRNFSAWSPVVSYQSSSPTSRDLELQHLGSNYPWWLAPSKTTQKLVVKYIMLMDNSSASLVYVIYFCHELISCFTCLAGVVCVVRQWMVWSCWDEKGKT